MASVREWQFKRKFRTNAYGWRASSFAIGRLKEAAAEIRSVAKSDPIAAGDGVVSLMGASGRRSKGIDTSSGALGAAVFRTVNELIPILTVAAADHATRSKWLDRRLHRRAVVRTPPSRVGMSRCRAASARCRRLELSGLCDRGSGTCPSPRRKACGDLGRCEMALDVKGALSRSRLFVVPRC